MTGGGGRGGPDGVGDRRGRLAGEQPGLRVAPSGVGRAVGAAEVGPRVGRSVPRPRVAGFGQAAAFGVPGRPRGRNRRHVRMVGKRGAAGALHPGNELTRGG